MSEYVPTTAEVRRVWCEWSDYGGLTNRPDYDGTRHQAEFNAWLAQHDREVKAAALRAVVEERAVNIPDMLGYKVPAVFVEDLLDAADRIESEARP